MIKIKKILTESIIEFTPEEQQFIEELKSGRVEIENAPDELMDKFYEFFNETMPYGTMKARTGDPLDWIMQHIDEIPVMKVKEAIGTVQETRYIVDFSMYMYAKDDNDVKHQAAKFRQKLEDKFDNQPKIGDISKAPFGTLDVTKIN